MTLPRVAYSPSGLVADVERHLETPGAVLISGFPCSRRNEALVALSMALGDVPVEGGDELENGFIARVEPRKDPESDDRRYAIISTTSRAFPCHTDELFRPDPAGLVLLLCHRPAETGGTSLLAYLDSVIDSLDEEVIAALGQPLFPVPFGKAALLESDDGRPWIRYNRLEIERAARHAGETLSSEVTETLDALDAAIELNTIRFDLCAGDCLVFDNLRVLHGRTALPPASRRLLKRVRVRPRRVEEDDL